MRSASGLMRRFDRSNSAYLLAIRKQRGQQLAVAEKIRNDEIRAYSSEALPLPRIDSAALGFRSRDSHRYPPDFLDIFDLHVPVAETQELAAFTLRLRN